MTVDLSFDVKFSSFPLGGLPDNNGEFGDGGEYVLKFKTIAAVLLVTGCARVAEPEAAPFPAFCSEPESVFQKHEGVDGVEDADRALQELGECPAEDVFSYVFAKGSGSSSQSDFAQAMEIFIAMELAKRGYGIVSATGKVHTQFVADYQRQNGFKPTGVLTVSQWVDLTEAMASEQNLPDNIWLHGGSLVHAGEDKPYVHYGNNFISFQGSWPGMDGSVLNPPLNLSKFYCDLTKKICEQTVLTLSTFSQDQVTADTRNYSHRISEISHPIYKLAPRSESRCELVEITVNVEQSEVIELRMPRADCGVEGFSKEPQMSRMRSAALQSREVRERGLALRQERQAPTVRDAYRRLRVGETE